jgi:hypothetical protein
MLNIYYAKGNNLPQIHEQWHIGVIFELMSGEIFFKKISEFPSAGYDSIRTENVNKYE